MMSVGFPCVVLCMSFVQNSVVPFQRLRISPACGQVSSIVISLCCPRNLTVVLLRSVRSWQNGCSSCIGSNGVRLAIPCTLTPIDPICFPIVSCFITWATSSGSSPSQASQAGSVNMLKTRGPCNRAAREQKPQFHFLAITLELARLGTSEGGSLLCLLGSTSTAGNSDSSSSKPAFIFSVNAAPFHQLAPPRYHCERDSLTRI